MFSVFGGGKWAIKFLKRLVFENVIVKKFYRGEIFELLTKILQNKFLTQKRL